jgi:formylglycine-generating enzyme required for sulfatase activity
MNGASRALPGNVSLCYGEAVRGCAAETLHPVALLRPNDLGLFDMHGNVSEWCHKPPETPHAAGSNTVARTGYGQIIGGAFGHGPLTMQPISSMEISAGEHGGDLGFRPVRTVRAATK